MVLAIFWGLFQWGETPTRVGLVVFSSLAAALGGFSLALPLSQSEVSFRGDEVTFYSLMTAVAAIGLSFCTAAVSVGLSQGGDWDWAQLWSAIGGALVGLFAGVLVGAAVPARVRGPKSRQSDGS